MARHGAELMRYINVVEDDYDDHEPLELDF
jgi:hypothetical protein